MATITVLDGNGDARTLEAPSSPGRAAASASKPVVIATEDLAVLTAIRDKILTEPATEAKQDAIIAAIENISPGGEGGGDASAAKQDEQTGVLEAIASALTGVASDTGIAAIIAALGETLAVSGPLTDTQLRATAVPVSGPLTDTQLRATAVPVSGPLTDTQLRATAVPVSAESLPLPSGAATSAKQDTMTAAVTALRGTEYETVAASQTAKVLGATGAIGDLLECLVIVPSSLPPGVVQIKDGSGDAITVFAGGEDSISALYPFAVPLGIKSAAGAWTVTTGANVSVIATGNFT